MNLQCDVDTNPAPTFVKNHHTSRTIAFQGVGYEIGVCPLLFFRFRDYELDKPPRPQGSKKTALKLGGVSQVDDADSLPFRRMGFMSPWRAWRAMEAGADAWRPAGTLDAVMHAPRASAEAERPAVGSAPQASLLYRSHLGLG